MYFLIIIIFIIIVIILAFSVIRGGGAGAGKEIEARFIIKDREKLLENIEKIGGIPVMKKTRFQRAVFKLNDAGEGKKGYARIRDEGKVVTMTVKINTPGEKYPYEEECELETDFITARNFINENMPFDENSSVETLGKNPMIKKMLMNFGPEKAYHVTLREKWGGPEVKKLGCNEITIDTIPGLPQYCEIEATSEKNLKKIAKLLGFKWSDAHFGAYGRTFEEIYGISDEYLNNEVKKLTIDSIHELESHVTKNLDLFRETIEKQKEEFAEFN